MSKWFVVLPPEGAARSVGEQFVPAFINQMGSDRVKVFDCYKYIKGFEKLLREPEDNMVIDLLNHSLIVQCIEYESTHLLVMA